jgi:prevent-host-death family protein
MSTLPKTQDIYSISEFKANAASMLRDFAKTDRPLILTQNGRSVGVVVPPSMFDEFIEQREFLKSLDRGLKDAEAGRVRTTTQLRNELKLS